MHLHYHGSPVESKAFPLKLARNLALNLAKAPGEENPRGAVAFCCTDSHLAAHAALSPKKPLTDRFDSVTFPR